MNSIVRINSATIKKPIFLKPEVEMLKNRNQQRKRKNYAKNSYTLRVTITNL